jgi:carbon-monoxide dehydrogenase medium subunit
MAAFLQPETLQEAINLLSGVKGVKVLSGGTDLIVNLRDERVSCDYILDCKKIPQLQALRNSESGLEVGAAVSLGRLLESDEVTGSFLILKQAASVLANTLIRNRATLIGNICNSSPGGDMIPASIVLDGRLEAVSSRGVRQIPVRKFFTGVKQNVLEPDELVTKIIFPVKAGHGLYKRRSRVSGHDLSQVGVAAFLSADGELDLAFGAVGPTPVYYQVEGTYARETIAADKDRIIKNALSKISPITDLRCTKEYRIAMADYLTSQIIDELSN